MAFGLGSFAAGFASFLTLLLPRGGALSHLGENATWGLILGAVVLALLAADGAKGRHLVRALIGSGIAAAGLRAIVLFAFGR